MYSGMFDRGFWKKRSAASAIARVASATFVSLFNPMETDNGDCGRSVSEFFGAFDLNMSYMSVRG